MSFFLGFVDEIIKLAQREVVIGPMTGKKEPPKDVGARGAPLPKKDNYLAIDKPKPIIGKELTYPKTITGKPITIKQ